MSAEKLTAKGPPEDNWRISLRHSGGWFPWHAHISKGVFRLGESGSTTYASRTSERSLHKALKTVASVAAREHPERIVVEVDCERPSW